METKKTDREVLTKGLQFMGICLFLMFAGPTLLHITFSNKEKPLFIPLLILSILLCLGAIFFLFKGINTIMNSMFGRKK
jgi:hypothetical protein